jgi:hypothetical protein
MRTVVTDLCLFTLLIKNDLFPKVSTESKTSKLSGFKKIPLAIKTLLLNPTYMFISLGAAADGLVIAGLSAFLPKFIQSQYKFPASLSSGIVGKKFLY